MDRTVQRMFDFIVEHPNCTERQIADGVGLKKTPYTRRILFQMWEQGYIVRWLDTDHKPRSAWKYYVQLTQPMGGI